MMMASAGIAVTDAHDVQVRYAARSGLGAVMGSKGIKTIVIDGTGTKPSQPYDAKFLHEANREFVQMLVSDPKIENRRRYGTSAIIMMANSLGILPTRNFSAGEFENAELIAGEHVADVNTERKGEGRYGMPCTRGCVIRCSNVFPDASGKKAVASIQYENIALRGSNCGIGDLDHIAPLNNLCNEVGLDAIETGVPLGLRWRPT